MRGKRLLVRVLLLGLMLRAVVGLSMAQGEGSEGGAAPQAPVGTGFTYQGRLSRGGSPYTGRCDFWFSLHDALSGGNQVGFVDKVVEVDVEEGLFTVALNSGNEFGSGAFTGDRRWLAIEVQCTGDDSYTALDPRQELTPAPYALALPGLWTQQNDTSPNVIGGYGGNSVADGVVGATIGGGGRPDRPNQVTRNYATIGGGGGNTASGTDATIGGGHYNTASMWLATVGGGWANTADAETATVGGGWMNTADGSEATVAGGYCNTASGMCATVPGGYENDAAGWQSFAAGTRAQALHHGTFVWADCGDDCQGPWNATPFASTADNQFLVQANGGVGLGINAPGNPLHVHGAGTDTGGVPTFGEVVAHFEQSVGQHAAISIDAPPGRDPILYLAQDGSAAWDLRYDASDADDRFEVRYQVGGANNTRLAVTSSGDVYIDGTYHDTGADLADLLPASEGLEPGDVLVVGPDGKLTGSTQPYQTSVVGVYSTQPGFVGGVGMRGERGGKVPLAVAGIVPVRVSAENGPIRPGDLLTTSSTPGHAMRCEGLELCFGRTLGKALDGLDVAQGTGVIKMLVMLQ